MSLETANVSIIIEELFQTMDEVLQQLKANTLLEIDKLIRFDFDCPVPQRSRITRSKIMSYPFATLGGCANMVISYTHLNAWHSKFEISSEEKL